MSFEVAALHATLGFKVEGTNDATTAARNIDRAYQEMAAGINSSSAEVQSAALDLRDAIDEFNRVAEATATAKQRMAQQGDSVDDLTSSIKALEGELNLLEQHGGVFAQFDTNQIEHAQRAMENIGVHSQSMAAQLETLGRQVGLSAEQYRVLVSALEETQGAAESTEEKIKDLREEIKELQAQRSLASGEDLVRAEADIDKEIRGVQRARRATGEFADAQGRLATSSRNLNGQFRLNRTSLTGLVQTLRTGNIGASVLSQGLAFLGSTAGAAAIAIGAAAIALVTLATKLFGAADALNAVRPRVLELAQSLEDLEQVDLANVAAQLGNIQNRLSSFGAENVEALSADIARIGSDLALLDDVVGNGEAGIQAFARAIESLNFEGLRDFGVPVNDLQKELEGLGDVSDDVARIHARDFVAAFLNSDAVMRQMEETAARQKDTFAGLGAEVKAMFTSLASSEAARSTIASLVQSIRALLHALEPLLVVVGAVAGALLWLANFVIRTVAAAMSGLARIVQGVLWVVGQFNEGAKEAGQSVGQWADDLDDIILNQENFEQSTHDSVDSLYGFGRAAEDTRTRLEKFRDSLNISSGLEGQLRGIGQAFADLQNGIDPGEVTNYVEQLSSGLDYIAERGVANVQRSFDALEDLLRQSFDAGMLSAEEFRVGLEELEAKRAFAEPLIDQVIKMEEEMDGATSKAQGAADTLNGALTPSIQTSGGAADSFAGQLGNAQGALHALQQQAAQGVHVQFTMSGSPGGGITSVGAPTLPGRRSGAGGGASARGTGGVTSARPGTVGGVPTGASSSRPTTPLPGRFPTGASTDRGRAAAEREARRVDWVDRANDFNRSRGIGGRGGGGGGGGGGGRSAREERLASIEEIKEFFDQVNAAILSGIRGGRVFSMAGNAIPLGGPGQFVSSQGGTLIESVNLRGVWDFADPAAKREIVRQLREALAEFGDEVA